MSSDPPNHRHLISYVAPGAPATRRPATEPLPYLRPEIGFTPRWYRSRGDVDFSRRWHEDVAYRRQTVEAMRGELRSRFGEAVEAAYRPLDLVTGTFGCAVVAAIYGLDIVCAEDNWPNVAHQHLSDEAADVLSPPDLDDNTFFRSLLDQLEVVAAMGVVPHGYLNWQGVLNNAQRLRGQALFLDMIEAPARARRIFDCVCRTMIEGARRFQDRQRALGVADLSQDPSAPLACGFFTVSNCLVNMVSPQQYERFLFPLDLRIAETFGCIGIHNCAWRADPYLEHYVRVPHLAYLDMGMQSDLERARERFPAGRRSLMYTPMDLANKPLDELRADFERIADAYAPCDVVLCDIDEGTPDERVLAAVDICREISAAAEGS